jgi:recombinational DNA repair protein RecT
MLDSNYHNSSFSKFAKQTAKDTPHSKITLRVEEDDEEGIVSVYAFDQFGDYLTSFSYMDRFEVEEDADMAIKEYQLDIEITK